MKGRGWVIRPLKTTFPFRVRYLELWRTQDQLGVRHSVRYLEKRAEKRLVNQAREIHIGFQQAHEIHESAVVRVAGVRCGGEQQQGVRVVPQHLRKLIILGLVDFSSIFLGTQAVRFVKDDQVPLAVFQEHALVLFPLQAVERSDGAGTQVPSARVGGSEVSPEDLKVVSLKLVFEFFLPLAGEPGGRDDERPVGISALQERLPHHARFDGLAQTHFVRQHEAPPSVRDHGKRGENLVREDFRAGVRELPALVQSQKARRHLPQVKLPGIVPMVGLGQFERRRADLKLSDFLQVVDGAVRRAREDRWVVFNLAERVPDFLDPADTQRSIDRV